MCQADCLAASVGVRMEKLHAVYITVCIIYIYIVDFYWTFPIAISNPQPGAGQLHDLRCPIAEAKEKDSGRVHRR